MKFLKWFVLLVITVVFGSCFDPPEFPNVPQIEFESIVFRRGVSASGSDTLILTLSFRDGDGDLGIDPTSPDFSSYPYNNNFYYQTDAQGGLNAVNTYNVTGDTLTFLDVNPALGKLVFPRTRKSPLYRTLPAYNCRYYEYVGFARLLVRESDKNVLDPSTTIVGSRTIGGTRYVEFRDTLYYTINPNHYNIEVDFFVRDQSNPNANAEGYVEFDWRTDNGDDCGQAFDGRFPVLGGEANPLEGTLKYKMLSTGFRRTFGARPIRLKVSVKDRALNKSNTIDTGPFTLN